MSKHEDIYWPDGTFKTKNNAFNVKYKPSDPSIKKIDRNARIGERSTRNVADMRAKGKEPAKLSPLTTKPARYSAPVVGRVAGEAQRDKSASIRRGGI